MVLAEGKELHSFTVDERNILEIHSQSARFLSQQVSEGFHVFSCKLSNNPQLDQVVSVNSSLDSADHYSVGRESKTSTIRKFMKTLGK